MRQLLSRSMVVLVATAGITGITLVSAGPVGAVASCTGVSGYVNTKGQPVAIPTIGQNTHQDNCELGLGNNSGAVAWLQFDLNQCYGENLAQDGNYGPLTKEAVQDAQAAAGIPQDGVYGPQTRDHIKWTNFNTGGSATCARL